MKLLAPVRRLPALTAAALLAFGLAAGPTAPDAVAQDGPLSVGDRAPAFPNPLPSTAGERPGATQIALQDVIGDKNIVLAFYVADWTGG